MLAGRDWVQTEAFEAFRGGYPFGAEFCAPAKGWEKGSVEGGVKYVRNLVLRPRLAVASWAPSSVFEHAAILAELEADLPTRHLDDARSVQDALTLERQHRERCPCTFPPPAASSREWPTSSDTSGWTTSPTRYRSATPTGRCG